MSSSAVLAPVPSHVPPERIVHVDMYNLEGIDQGFHEAWGRLKKAGMPDLVWTPYTGGHWIAMTNDVMQEVYGDPSRFSSENIWLPKEAGEKYAMVPTRMDPPEHTPYRQVLGKGLSVVQMKGLEDQVRATAAELIESFVGKGRCDFTKDYAAIFPVKVFMALADLPMEDVPRLNQLANRMTRPPGNTAEEQAKALDEANKGFFAYVDPIIKARRGKDGKDLITLMVNSDINGAPMPHDKALGLVALLLLAGLDTVVNFLSFFMIHLAQRPDKVKELQSNSMTLLRGVEELFRRFPVVSDARMVAKDQYYRGVQLKRGDMILLPTALAGLDSAKNDNPWELNFGRSKISHATFGGGPHRCAGLHLARLEVTVTLQEWFKRIPAFTLAPGAKPIYHAGIVAAVENVPLIWGNV